MSEPIGTYDAYGVFTLTDVALIDKVTGGNIDFYMNAYIGLYGDGTIHQSVPTSARQTTVNVDCQWIGAHSGEVYNFECRENTGGTNPVCYSNLAC